MLNSVKRQRYKDFFEFLFSNRTFFTTFFRSSGEVVFGSVSEFVPRLPKNVSRHPGRG